MFNVAPNDIPAELHLQRQMFYDLATQEYAPIYAPLDTETFDVFEVNNYVPGGNPMYPSERARILPPVWRLYGFGHARRGEDVRSAYDDPDRFERTQNGHLIDREFLYFYSVFDDEATVDEGINMELSYRPPPEGDTVWACYFGGEQLSFLGQYAYPHYSGDGSLKHKETMCHRTTNAIIEWNNLPETDEYRDIVYNLLWHEGYYLDNNGMFFQIGRVTFLPFGK